MRELHVARIERRHAPAGRIQYGRPVEYDVLRIHDAHGEIHPFAIAVVADATVPRTADNAIARHLNIFRAINLERSQHKGVFVQKYAVMALQLHDDRFMDARPEDDVRLRPLFGEVAFFIHKDFQRIVITVQFQHIITGLRQRETDFAIGNSRFHARPQWPHFRDVERTRRLHDEFRRPFRLNFHHARDFRLIRRPLIARSPLVERHRRHTDGPHEHRFAIDCHIIARLLREEAFQNAAGDFRHAFVARMILHASMFEKPKSHHRFVFREIRLDERQRQIAGGMLHHGVLPDVRPEDAAHHCVRLGATAHESAQQLLEGVTEGKTFLLRL